MLRLTIPDMELWDEETQTFQYINGGTLVLEHSLIAISKWESKWHKPFLNGSTELSMEETLDYIRCMTVNPGVNPDIYNILKNEHFLYINSYIEDPSTATMFYSDDLSSESGNSEVVTSELIYYWMVAYNIPFEAQKWHINRLIALIKICNIKNQPPKQLTQAEIFERNRRLNEERRKKYNTKG